MSARARKSAIVHPYGAEAVRITTLPNGLRVVSETMAHAATVALGVWIGAGSRHEKPQEHGLAHLLEHMAFKGTARRSARCIAEQIESVGGDLNAATSLEYTCYTARVLGADLPLAVDILADILLGSRFEPAELAREKDVILQEIAAVEDTPDDLVYDLFLAQAFASHALGRPILGARETVASFDAAAIRGYLARCYQPGRMVVAAAGAVDHDQLCAFVTEHFHADMPDTAAADPWQEEKAHYTGGDIRKVQRLDQAHLVLGFAGQPFVEGAHDAVQVLATVMGGGMSSRLFQEVREERGLAYSIDAFHWPFRDTGVFGIGVGAAPARLPEVVNVSLASLARAADTVTEEEVARARAQMKVGLLGSLETPGGRVEHLARQVLTYGTVRTRAEIIARVDAVDAAAVRHAASGMVDGPMTVALVGPSVRFPAANRLAQGQILLPDRAKLH